MSKLIPYFSKCQSRKISFYLKLLQQNSEFKRFKVSYFIPKQKDTPNHCQVFPIAPPRQNQIFRSCRNSEFLVPRLNEVLPLPTLVLAAALLRAETARTDTSIRTPLIHGGCDLPAPVPRTEATITRLERKLHRETTSTKEVGKIVVSKRGIYLL